MDVFYMPYFYLGSINMMFNYEMCTKNVMDFF